jgi:hypothetical protein
MPEKMYQFGFGVGVPEVIWTNEPLVIDEHGDSHLQRGPRQTHIAQIDAGSGFPNGMERPVVVFERSRGTFPETMIEPLGGRNTLLISSDFKAFLELIDKDAFEFVEAESRIVTKKGERQGPAYWAADLVQFVDALDPAYAEVREYPGYYTLIGPSGGTKARFFRSKLKGKHIFRIPTDPNYIVCDEFFRRAAIDSGFKWRMGMRAIGFVEEDE